MAFGEAGDPEGIRLRRTVQNAGLTLRNLDHAARSKALEDKPTCPVDQLDRRRGGRRRLVTLRFEGQRLATEIEHGHNTGTAVRAGARFDQ